MNNNKGYWDGRRVLVTGCTGLLGSWLTRELLARGAQVTGLVRDMVPQSNLILSDTVHRIATVRGELEDFRLLERTINEYEIEVVFHLAAQAIVGTANRNPVSTFKANIEGTWNLLEACRRVGNLKGIVIASSDKAYGIQENLPYTEDMPLQGSYPYDVSKSCADLIGHCYYATYGLPVGITRCGNFFGGGDLNFNRIVPGTISSVLRNERPLIRSDGTLIRDYIYMLDVVDAYLLLAEKLEDPTLHGEAFNFSNEIQMSVLDLTNKILRLMDRTDLEPVILNEAKGEIQHQYLTATKARERLGWKPKYSIDDALMQTIDWYRGFFETTHRKIV
jgi:CDP-glucose 4,6-dehydratase